MAIWKPKVINLRHLPGHMYALMTRLCRQIQKRPGYERPFYEQRYVTAALAHLGFIEALGLSRELLWTMDEETSGADFLIEHFKIDPKASPSKGGHSMNIHQEFKADLYPLVATNWRTWDTQLRGFVFQHQIEDKPIWYPRKEDEDKENEEALAYYIPADEIWSPGELLRVLDIPLEVVI